MLFSDDELLLVLGAAIPEGEGVYVLVRSALLSGVHSAPSDHFLLINAYTGLVYRSV